MAIVFRRICTRCQRTVTWESEGDLDLTGTFYHLDDYSLLCDGANVDLEIKETS